MTPLEKRKLIWQLLDKGMKKKEIVEKTGIPYGTVYMYAKQKNELQDSLDGSDNSDRHLCMTCQYRHGVNRGCDYCIHTGKERGCVVEVCDKAVKGPRLTKE